jgi:acetoacetyl-CoA synthetase
MDVCIYIYIIIYLYVGIPWLPVYEGELQGAILGMDVTVMDETGTEDLSRTGGLGELTCRCVCLCVL